MVNKIEWLACVTGIIGAFTVASNTQYSGFGFIPFLIGALAYIYVAVRIQNVKLFLLNVVFACANLVGIFRWLF
jgi:nicotinamide riboside transporter PnuC